MLYNTIHCITLYCVTLYEFINTNVVNKKQFVDSIPIRGDEIFT